MIQKEQILSIARNLCWEVARKIYEPDGVAIKFMDDYETWIKKNKDSLPTYFLENWEQAHKCLDESIQKEKHRKGMPEGRENEKLADEISDLRIMSCIGLLEETATLIKQELDSLENSDEDNGIKSPEIQTGFQVETKIKESDRKNPSVAAKKVDSTKIARSEETKKDVINHKQTQAKGKEYLKLWLLVFLIIIFLGIIASRFTGTPADTQGGASVPSFTEIVSSLPKRDLSTPSSRLVGHWVGDKGGSELYFSPVCPSLQIGTYILDNWNTKPSPPMTFKVLFEDTSGKCLIIREYSKHSHLLELGAKIGMKMTMSDVTLCISKDGQSMTREYIQGWTPVLEVLHYVDEKTIP